MILFNDIYTNGVNISQPITRVAYENYPKKYYLMIEQRAITKNVFTYLEAIKEQTESNGTPFDIPAQTQFSTNIRCTTDPSEKILGVFNTYNLKKRLIYVDRSGPIPGVTIKTDAELVRPTYLCAPPFPPPCKAPCQESYYVTQTKPEGWVD